MVEVYSVNNTLCAYPKCAHIAFLFKGKDLRDSKKNLIQKIKQSAWNGIPASGPTYLFLLAELS